MEPNKINYRDLYPFDDDDVIEEVSTIIGKDCPEYDLLIAKLKKYDEQAFCNSLLFAVSYHLMLSYPVIFDLFLQSEIKSNEKLNSLMVDLVLLDEDDDPLLWSSELLNGIVNLILLQGEYVFFRKIKKYIPTFSRDNAHRVYKLLQEANSFRIVELFKIFYKKASENDSANSKNSIFDCWDFDKKFDVGDLLIGTHINSCLSEIIIKNNQEKYDKFKQDIERWGFGLSAFQTYTTDDSNVNIIDNFYKYLLIHEGLFVKVFFKYVLSQEDLSVDELDLIYEFLAKNHVSALAEKEYNKYKDHYGWPERQFSPDKPITFDYHFEKLSHISETMLEILCGELKKSNSTRKAFISSDTDIKDFIYVFGIGERRADFTPIKWIGMNNGRAGRNQILYMLGSMGYPVEDIKDADGRKIINACFCFSAKTRTGGYEPKDFPNGKYPIPSEHVKKIIDTCLTNAGIEIMTW